MCSVPARASLRPTGSGAQVRCGPQAGPHPAEGNNGSAGDLQAAAYPATRGAPAGQLLPAPASLPKRPFTSLSTTPSVPPHVKAVLAAAFVLMTVLFHHFQSCTFIKIILFIYGCAGLCCCKAFLQLQWAGATLAAVGTGFSPQRLLSLCVEQGLGRPGPELRRVGMVAPRCRDKGLDLCFLLWQVESPPQSHQGSPAAADFDQRLYNSYSTHPRGLSIWIRSHKVVCKVMNDQVAGGRKPSGTEVSWRWHADIRAPGWDQGWTLTGLGYDLSSATSWLAACNGSSYSGSCESGGSAPGKATEGLQGGPARDSAQKSLGRRPLGELIAFLLYAICNLSILLSNFI